ncbi:oxa1 multicopy suppressor [Histoplasma ohiense]|nr:oxa1 multicopy suppressor [Histoplasma ohiense (nom. inval.)]
MVSSPNAKRPAKSGNARTSKQSPLAPSQRARPNRPPFQSAPVQAAPPRTRSINPKGLTVCAVAAFCFSTYGTYLYVTYDRTVKQSKNLSVPDDVSDRFHKTAPTYDANVELTERIMRISKKREELVKRARGNVLEVACGTGRNMQYYSLGERRGTDKNGKAEIQGCRSVTFVDQSPQMVEIAREKFEKMYPHFRRAAFWAQDAMAPIPPLEHTTAMQGSSQSSGSSSLGNSNNNKGNGNGSKSLPTTRAQQQSCTFDTVIQTMGLCSLPDPVSYLKHLGTLVEPERGEILLLEHGRSHYRWLNKLLDDLAAAHADRHGCWWNRDIGEIVRQSGLEIVESKRWHMGTTWRFILRRKAEGTGREKKDVGLAEISEREENGDGAAKSVMGWLGWGAKKS